MLTKLEHKPEFRQWLRIIQCDDSQLSYSQRLCKFWTTIQTVDEIDEMIVQLQLENVVPKYLKERWDLNDCIDALCKQYYTIAKQHLGKNNQK